MPPPLYTIQPNFSGGEFTPGLWARVDLQKYLSGLRTALNVNVLPQGGVRNRPGTQLVALAGDSTKPIRVIPFVASTTQAYVIELGHQYARFYFNGAPVMNGMNPYQIVTPWAAADIFNLKFAQSADVMFFAHPSYAPQQLTFNASTNWTLIPFPNINGPFMVENIDQTITITATAPAWVPNGTSYAKGQYVSQGTGLIPADLVDDFSSGNASLWTSPGGGQDSYGVSLDNVNGGGTCTITTGATLKPPLSKAAGGPYGTTTALMQNSILFFCMSTNAVSSNFPSGDGYILRCYQNNNNLAIDVGRVSGGVIASLFYTNQFAQFNPRVPHYISVVRNSSSPLLFSVFIDGIAAGFGIADVSYTSGANWFIDAYNSTTGTITNLYYDVSPFATCRAPAQSWIAKVASVSSAGFLNEISLGYWSQVPGVGGAGVPVTASSAIFNAQQVGAQFQIVHTLQAPSLIDSAFTNNSYVSAAIPCGPTWNIVTQGTWNGKIYIQASIDGGITWSSLQTLTSPTGTSQNYTESGETGFSQCLIRVAAWNGVPWGGTLTINLNLTPFDWVAVFTITGYTSPTQITATVQANSGLASNIYSNAPTSQWSEGSWSEYRGFPTTVVFFQDRLHWSGTTTEPETVWASKTSAYVDYGVSVPLVDSDGLSIVLPSRRLNAVQSLAVMPQYLVALTSDSEFGINQGGNGVYAPTSISTSIQGHRGSAYLDPVTIGIELLVVQQMGTVIRNMVFPPFGQLAVSSFTGDNISLVSQHLFTGYTISDWAYQQEPDSIVWAVRNDGALLSLTYMREQEVSAWSRHNTAGNFESVCTIPNTSLGINEVWFAVNRQLNGAATRCIERLQPRDQGTDPKLQWFVDCATQYSGAKATTVTGLAYLNGLNVSILADGNVVANPNDPNLPIVTVAGGQITLPSQAVASSVITVGLPYVSDIETLKIEAGDQRGTLQGRRVAIPKATLRFWNSRGGYFGGKAPATAGGLNDADGNQVLDPIEQRDGSTASTVATPLQTEDFLQDVPAGDFAFGAHLFFRQIDPLPFTLTAIMPVVVSAEN